MRAEDPGYSTFARELTDVTVIGAGERVDHGAITLGLVPVSVTHRVTGFLRRRLTGEVIDFIDLDMPERQLTTTAVMYTIQPEAMHRNGIAAPRIPGSLHAAEHAAIGLLPLMASCDRGDIGGLSTAAGESGLPTVFVYDGHPGARDSPNAATGPPGSGWARQPRRSPHASADTVAPPACSRPNAGTATTRSTRPVRWRCCTSCCPNSTADQATESPFVPQPHIAAPDARPPTDPSTTVDSRDWVFRIASPTAPRMLEEARANRASASDG